MVFIRKKKKGQNKFFHTEIPNLSSPTPTIAKKIQILLQRDLKRQTWVWRRFTCWGEDFKATGQTGHFQSSTDKEDNVTARIAWVVETRRLQNSNERFGNDFLISRKAVVHERTPKRRRFLTWSSIFFTFFLLKGRHPKILEGLDRRSKLWCTEIECFVYL